MFYNSLKNLESLSHMINNGHTEKYLKNSDVNISLNKKVLNKANYLFFTFKLLFKKNKIKKTNWLIYETINNYNALKFLENDKNEFVKPNSSLIFKYLFFYKIFYTIPLFIYLLKKNKIKWFFAYYERLGILEESERLLKKYKPKKLIFSNDHNPYQVALRIKAQKLNIPTFYFQHACIGLNMPPLEFDVAFLDGKDALNKYKKIGTIKSKIELIGMVRTEKERFINNKKQVKSIGIAVNLLDDIENVKLIANKILEVFPNIKIVIRMHPRDSRIIKIPSSRIIYSNSRQEGVFHFLEKIDLIIAGDSSIHLEAAICNIVPFYFKFSNNNINDYYGFVQNNLVYNIKNSNDLINRIKEEIKTKSQVIQKAAYYDEYITMKKDYKQILKKYNLI